MLAANRCTISKQFHKIEMNPEDSIPRMKVLFWRRRRFVRSFWDLSILRLAGHNG